MKTVVIVHHTGDWGGGTKSLVDLCEMLRKDYRVVVCIPKGYPAFAEKIAQYGCSVHELSVSVPFVNLYSGSPPLLSVISLRSIRSLFNMRRVGDEILSLKPDIVLFNTLVTAVTARYLSRYTKVVCIDRETLTGRLSIRLYRRLLDRHLDAITCLSEYERKKLDFKHADSLVFPDCIRMDALTAGDAAEIRAKEGISDDRYAVLFMGGLAQLKGTDVMLEAVDALDERFVLIFAGAMNEAKLSKKQLLHDLKYPGIYRFKKRVIRSYQRLKGTPKLYEAGLQDSVDELIIASDLVVFPSTSVHQPRPCIEAGAYGKPVILSDYPETAEFFRDGYNALTFRPGDARDLAGKILYACENPAEMERLGNNNRRMTETKHDFYSCKEIICSLIEKVCKDAHQNQR